MKSTLVVFAGYLAAEILLEGAVAAAAVLALTVLEFLFILVFRGERHTSLLIEGGVLALIVIAGHYLASAGYSGSELVLLELVLGATLLVSSLIGRPWLSSLMDRFPGLSPGDRSAGTLSMGMGSLFLLHGAFMGAWVAFHGGIDIPMAVLVFAVLYSLMVIHTRGRLKREAVRGMPRLLAVDGYGGVVLESGGRRLGTLEVETGSVALARRLRAEEGVEMHRFLGALETALRSSGCLSVRIVEWEGDPLPLELSGYRQSPAGWTRPL